MSDYVRLYLDGLTAALASVSAAQIEAATDLLWDNYQGGRRVLFCGNGGSASTASHLPADFQKNLLLDGGHAWECLSLGDSLPLVTAWGNDTGYANVFAGPVRTWVRRGDLLVAISGSGNSANVLSAVATARELGGVSLGLCGFGGGALSGAADACVVVHSWNMQMVEDVHLALGHLFYSALRDRIQAQRDNN